MALNVDPRDRLALIVQEAAERLCRRAEWRCRAMGRCPPDGHRRRHQAQRRIGEILGCIERRCESPATRPSRSGASDPRCNPGWNAADDEAAAALPGLRALFEDACSRYDAAKDERRAVDFLDLEVDAVRLLESAPSVLDATRERYRHLMVDEAQDISPIQARLLRLLAGVGPGQPSALPGRRREAIDLRLPRRGRAAVPGAAGLRRRARRTMVSTLPLIPHAC